MTRWSRPSRRARRDDEGFTLVEVIVSILVFGVMSSALVSLVLALQVRTADNLRREQAASIAAQTVDELRGASVGDAEFKARLGRTGRQPDQVVLVGKNSYTVSTDTVWQTRSQNDSGCGKAVDRSYVQVRVAVTWPGMRAGQEPVRADTIITPLGGTFNDTLGSLCLRITGAGGRAVAGGQGTLDAGAESALTTEEGVVLFPRLSGGLHSVQVSGGQLVDAQGATSVTRSATVEPAKTAQVQIEMDRAATVELVGTDKLPSGLPLAITATNTGLSAGARVVGQLQRTSGVSTSLTGLFPFTDGYGIRVAPLCPTPAFPGVNTSPGLVTRIDLPLVRVSSSGGATVTAGSTCGGHTYSISATPAGVEVALWPGAWTFTSGLTTVPVTLTTGTMTPVALP